MMLHFPSLDTLRLALGGGQIPAEIAGASVEAIFSDDGAIHVWPVTGGLTKSALNQLKKIGVLSVKEKPVGEIKTYLSWATLLPTTKMASVPESAANAAVLFELSPDEFPELVNEMMRLGNDRQSYRVMSDAAEKDSPRVLLKVFGPPYYSLLRAIDRSANSTMLAYSEASPGVWIQYGYTHPLQTRIKPGAGQVILMRAGHDWVVTADEQFADIYEALDVVLPQEPVEWAESSLKGKLVVPLRLTPGNAADLPEFWVLHENAVNQLDALVREADDRLIQRLAFAISQKEGEAPTVILKTRPSKLQPPSLSLDHAVAFKAYWKLPNLFLPVGRRLMPTLRRETVRRLLADDPSRLFWLMPGEGTDFQPESLPDTAFRPLEDWVDYVIDHEREALAVWVRATQFDFESFLCKEEKGDKPGDVPPASKKSRSRKEVTSAVSPRDEGKESSADSTSIEPFVSQTERVGELSANANELRIQREKLESDFLTVTGGLDADERQRLWPDLARLNTSLNDLSESAICWSNVLWQTKEDVGESAWAWLRGEDRDARRIPIDAEFDEALNTANPSGQQIRALTVRTIYACGLKPIPESLISKLPAIRAFLERHEMVLGVRSVWLAWNAIAGAVGGSADILALARVRDRMLNRLFTEGLNKERDLPCFLRNGGTQSGERTRGLRERALRLFRLVAKWHEQDDAKVNRPYVELMFAFGFAKLGEITTARELMDTARNQLLAGKNGPDPVHEVLAKAFCWRIENAINGVAHTGSIPDELLSRLTAVESARNNAASSQYVVDRMRQEYWILEPGQKSPAYASWYGKNTDLRRFTSDIAAIRDTTKLAEAIRKLMATQTTPEGKTELFARLLPHAVRAGEALALEILIKIPTLIAESLRSEQSPATMLSQCHLLEQGLRVAGHFEKREQSQELFRLFLDQVNRQKTPQARYEAINRIAGEGIRHLRKLGLRDEIDRFLKQISDMLLDGKSLDFMRRTSGTSWPDLLVALLNLAEGWQYFGAIDQATPILDEARQTLFANAKEPKEKRLVPRVITKITKAYIAAAAQGPIHEALNRVEELFQHLEKLPNTFTTASHFSRLHLDIVEEIVRSLIHDNLADDGAARRWLDEDEYLVRRRIHADFHTLYEKSQLN